MIKNVEPWDEYVNGVLSGEIMAGLYIQQACQRFNSWLERDDMIFQPEKVWKVIRFVERFKQTESKDAGKPLKLTLWQTFLLAHVYGFFWKKEPDRRVVHNIYLQVARKAGKSTLIAALALYNFIADGEAGAQVYVVANSAKQAGLLYDMSSKFAKQLDPRQKLIKRYRDSLRLPRLEAKMQVLSNNPDAAVGSNPSFFVVDEYFAASNNDMYNALKTGQLQRKNPLAMVITTAGTDQTSPCYLMRNTCTEILAGLKEDDTQVALIYELDEEDDWRNEDVWQKCQPNLDITVEREAIRAEVQRADNDPSLKSSILTLNFNIWLSESDRWLPPALVNAACKDIPDEFFRDKTVYVGVDLASVDDLTALSIMALDNDNKPVLKTFYFLPYDTINKGVNSQSYQRWKRSGYLAATPGNVTDYDYILGKILQLQSDLNLYVQGVYYDSWNSTFFAIKAVEAGLPMIPYSQSLGSFNRPTKEFIRLVKCGGLRMDANPITRWCIDNVALKTDWNENAKPIKKGDHSKKIDGVISMIQSLAGYLLTPAYDNTITI